MKNRKNMTIVRYGNMQDAPELTFKSFAFKKKLNVFTCLGQ